MCIRDRSYLIGPPPVNQSYLNSDMIIEKAILSGANLIHPGYGLLSENASFAQKVEAAGLLWVGPSSTTIELMADKGKARSVAIEAGVPVLPGSLPIDPNDTSLLLESANNIGLPLLVKATGGGGGIGMQVAESLEDLPKIAKSVSSLAERTFGNNEIFLERYIANARHIEVQVFGLGNGSVFHLLHRECSVQRRFQKIIETDNSNANYESMINASVLFFAVGGFCWWLGQISDRAWFTNGGLIFILISMEQISLEKYQMLAIVLI